LQLKTLTVLAVFWQRISRLFPEDLQRIARKVDEFGRSFVSGNRKEIFLCCSDSAECSKDIFTVYYATPLGVQHVLPCMPPGDYATSEWPT
jgi:hypothetical protein